MNKLKNKVFFVLLFILTFFLITILAIVNYQYYRREKSDIENNLMRMEDNFKTNDDKFSSIKSDEPKIFIDVTAYTILLDENDNIIGVTSHSENSLSDDEIKLVAEEIISSGDRNTNVGNLYFSNYSYSFKKDSLVIIDNQNTKAKLVSLLKTSIAIFVLLEFVILYVSFKLTSWMIKPVEDTFNKQKQFIADASHELKTPLSVIMASADAIESDPSEKKWLNNIKSEADRMSKLISSLLDLAKTESNVNKEEYIKTNLSKIIEMQVLTFEAIIYEKKISLDYNIEENLEFVCNVDEIKELMSILLDNAVSHSIKNGEIKVYLKKDKNEFILEVINKGEGIPKDEEEKIFERFYRVDKSRNRNENRYGLGLAIAKSIVLNHNGKISARSSNGYTTFKVVFKEK